MTLNNAYPTGKRDWVLVIHDIEDGKKVGERRIKYATKESLKRGIRYHIRQSRSEFTEWGKIGHISNRVNPTDRTYTLMTSHNVSKWPAYSVSIAELIGLK